MDSAAVTALLGLLSLLVSALIWIMKSEWKRATHREAALEVALAKRDDTLERTLKLLGDTVKAFQEFEKEENDTHKEILRRLDTHEGLLNGIVSAQSALANQVERIADKLTKDKEV